MQLFITNNIFPQKENGAQPTFGTVTVVISKVVFVIIKGLRVSMVVTDRSP